MKQFIFSVEEVMGKVVGYIMRPFWPLSAWVLVLFAESVRSLPRRWALILTPFVETYAWVALARKKPWFKRLKLLDGSTLEFDLSEGADRVMYTSPVYEQGLALLFRSVIERGDVVLDIGANIGYYSLLAASKGAKVLAYEPDPKNFARVVRNSKINQYWNIVPRQEAVGAQEGTATLNINPINRGGNTLLPEVPYRVGQGHSYKTLSKTQVEGMYEEPLTYEVRVTSVDDILVEYNIDRIRALKMDVEGFEAAVFTGMEKAIKARKIDYLFCELVDKRQETIDFMASHGYTCKSVTDIGTLTAPKSRDVVFIRN